MHGHFKGIKISAIASCVPKEIFDPSSAFDRWPEADVRRLMDQIGVNSLRRARSGLFASDLAAFSAQEILNNLNISPKEVDGIIYVSSMPEYFQPQMSTILQDRLGLSPNALTFDINYSCSGYLMGLFQACMMLTATPAKKILFLAAELPSGYTNPSDRSTFFLFGDAGCATLLERDSSADHSLQFLTQVDGSRHQALVKHCFDLREEHLLQEQYFSMDGAAVMNFIMQEIPVLVKSLLDLHQLRLDEVGSYVFHQANKMVLDFLTMKLNLAPQKVLRSIGSYGNTTVSSPAITLCANFDKVDFMNLSKTLLCAFGSGLSWAGTIADLSQTKIFGVKEI